ncbi:MAG: S-adenosylmethionine:tRNA ribosyltransferase-isomerase, partial [Bacteroidales bacterium]
MIKTEEIRIEEFDYPLPDERIAKFPLAKRDTSKLLVYNQGDISTHSFGDL